MTWDMKYKLLMWIIAFVIFLISIIMRGWWQKMDRKGILISCILFFIIWFIEIVWRSNHFDSFWVLAWWGISLIIQSIINSKN